MRQNNETSLSSFETSGVSGKKDRLDSLVRKIFETIDTYYIEWQAEEITEMIREFVEQQIAERQKAQPSKQD